MSASSPIQAPYRELLIRGAHETRAYVASSERLPYPPKDSWLALADSMDEAATLQDMHEIESRIHAIVYMLSDMFPFSPAFCPSFHDALEALQAIEKARRVT
jgi:hypothetical protein